VNIMTRPLFDDIDRIAAQVALAPHIILYVDFDGTLASIVEEPALAGLSPHMDRVVRALADNPGVSVAVLSGRDRADLQARLPIPGLIYAGNHGLEINGHGFIFVEPTAAQCAQAMKDIAAEISRRVHSIEGALVEDKGLTVSIHYRMVSEYKVEEVRRVVHAVLAASNHPFQLNAGDKVYEIRPRVYWNKGTAVEWIRQQLDKPGALAIYVGDDTTDEDAFAVLPDDITIKVGGSGETAAHYSLADTAEVRKFLEWLPTQLRQPASAPVISERRSAVGSAP
jgi:trehalose 6-phosphate phosphatase